MPKEADFGAKELCFLWVTVELVLFKGVQDCGNILEMSVDGF